MQCYYPAGLMCVCSRLYPEEKRKLERQMTKKKQMRYKLNYQFGDVNLTDPEKSCYFPPVFLLNAC